MLTVAPGGIDVGFGKGMGTDVGVGIGCGTEIDVDCAFSASSC